MIHKSYWKIHSIDKEECEWILNWQCVIQEKIDWANLSVWRTNDWIFVWSRTQIVGTPEIKTWFRWAVEYINNHPWTLQLFDYLEDKLLTDDIRIYWEWLVAHTITDYNKEAYNHFYLFDIEIWWKRLPPVLVKTLAKDFWFKYPEVFEVINNPTLEKIKEYVWKTTLKDSWKWGEGVVIKNISFINKFGNAVYAKIVCDNFKESNQIVFTNWNKKDNELDIVSKYCDLERVKKIINKIEQNDWVDINKSHIAKILWLVFYDIITEEANNIAKKWVVDFDRLRKMINERSRRISIDLIEWNEMSVIFNN
jgi:hypothetical protein